MLLLQIPFNHCLERGPVAGGTLLSIKGEEERSLFLCNRVSLLYHWQLNLDLTSLLDVKCANCFNLVHMTCIILNNSKLCSTLEDIS